MQLTQLSVANVSCLCLGAFVGWILAYGLFTVGGNAIKAAIIVVGTAVGTQPYFFKSTVPGIAFYPIGLLIGLCFMSLPVLRKELSILELEKLKKYRILILIVSFVLDLALAVFG